MLTSEANNNMLPSTGADKSDQYTSQYTSQFQIISTFKFQIFSIFSLFIVSISGVLPICTVHHPQIIKMYGFQFSFD